MEKLKLYSVSDEYIRFLRADEKLIHIYDNKELERKKTRKYLGIALSIGDINYYIPLSSPKENDYELINGELKIKKDSPTIIRITALNDFTKKTELKGTLRISNMIPVPMTELIPYNINDETSQGYKNLIIKQYKFIGKNTIYIRKKAEMIYEQRQAFEAGKKMPEYIKSVIPFKYDEKTMRVFIEQNNELMKATEPTAVAENSPVGNYGDEKGSENSCEALLSRLDEIKEWASSVTKAIDSLEKDIQEIKAR
ncbi:MAG: type III toxin-antitoxin system ToxN/AbiQ family toxin [Oscillospiraceae bacterium]|nr:type III toxin-antitoxin system ToxN/AbiQ family toxin [Oscillospiraceae bacterium]